MEAMNLWMLALRREPENTVGLLVFAWVGRSVPQRRSKLEKRFEASTSSNSGLSTASDCELNLKSHEGLAQRRGEQPSLSTSASPQMSQFCSHKANLKITSCVSQFVPNGDPECAPRTAAPPGNCQEATYSSKLRGRVPTFTKSRLEIIPDKDASPCMLPMTNCFLKIGISTTG
jgi:hypothetical protein